MKSKLLILFATLFLASACTTTTYVPFSEDKKQGYEERKLDQNQYIVSYRGLPKTSRIKALNLATLRASELAKDSGFSHFELIRVQDRSVPSISHLGDEGTFSAGRPIIISKRGPSGEVTSRLPSDIVSIPADIQKFDPHLVMQIKLMNYNGPDREDVYNADATFDEIRKRYKIEE